MKRKIQLLLAVSVFLLVVFGFGIIPAVAVATKREAMENKQYTRWDPIFGETVRYEIEINMQGDLVYHSCCGGYVDYAMWLYGINKDTYNPFFSRRILTYIYVTAYYRQEIVLPIQETILYWDPTPDGLIEWTGDWDIHLDVSDYQWQWVVGGQTRYTDGKDNTGAHGSKSHSSQNQIDGDYRYLGWAKVQKSGWFVYYDGLLKLDVDNELAEDWDNGVWGFDGYFMWITYLEKIRVKFITYFQYEWFGWRTSKTFTIILGDGTPSSDLSSIPLVSGTVSGLVEI